MSSGDVDMYSYRAEAADLLGGSTVQLLGSDGDSVDGATAVTFNWTAAALGLNATTEVDTQVATVATNLHAYALRGTEGTAAAAASRFDLGTTGGLLLRSALTLVRVVMHDDVAEFAAPPGGWGAGAVGVTLAATVPFNTSFAGFDRSFGCGTDGTVVDLQCPYETWSHTCDWATHGGGGPYHVEATCPYVVPTCLWFDDAAQAFSGEACTVRSGYTSESVTCECSALGTLALSGNATSRAFQAIATPAPTQSPTEAPSPAPTKAPTGVPTWVPSPAPTEVPAPSPTAVPTVVPTAVPTTRPTTDDTTTVSVDLVVTASGPPTPGDEAALKAAVANATGVVEGDVKNFLLTYTNTTRRRLVGGTCL